MNLAIKIAAAILSVPPDVLAPMVPMMAPPPRNDLEMQLRDEVDTALMGHCCSASATGEEHDADPDAPLFALSKEETRFVDCQSGLPSFAADNLYEGSGGGDGGDDEDSQPSTYGEVTMLGARQLFYHMNLLNIVNHNNERQLSNENTHKQQFKFFDLGSGGGRLVIQSHLEIPSVIKSVGIELSPTRHAIALRTWDRLNFSGEAERIRRLGEQSWGITRHDNADAPSVELYEGDLFELDISEATHIYVSSLCFTEEMMERIVDKIEMEGGSLQILASLRALPLRNRWRKLSEWDEEVMRRRKVELGTKPWTEFVEMSWTKATGDGCPVYFYTAKKLQ